MEKLLLFTLLLLSINLNAQTEKDKFFISGSSNAVLLSANTEGSANSSLNINFSPAVGYFILNDLTIGISALYSYAKMKTTYSITYPYLSSYSLNTESSIYQFSPFIRLYFPAMNLNSRFFTQIEGGYADVYNNEGTFYSGTIGAAVFFNHHVSFDVGASYTRLIFGKNITNNFGLDLGFTLFLGKSKE